MPNWCENRMAVCGKAEDVRRFVETAQDGKEALSFAKFIPEDYDDPAYQDGQEKNCEGLEPNPHWNWYDWRCDHWGCKWDCSESYVEVSPDGTLATFTFTTPWGAPDAFYRAITGKFPELSFECYAYEGGNDYWFAFAGADGEVDNEETQGVWDAGRVQESLRAKLEEIGIDPSGIDLEALRDQLSVDVDTENFDISEYPHADFTFFEDDDEIKEYAEECRK